MLSQKCGWKLLVVSLVIFVALILPAEAEVYSDNPDIQALTVFRHNLTDPKNVLGTWDPTLVDPCTWFHITCENNKVIRVDLTHANLSGHLVPELGTLTDLQYLDLTGNNLEGTIPSELGNLKNLIGIYFDHNRLTGSIPPSLGNLGKLRYLWLNDNQLTGRVPDEIKRMGLMVLNVTGNPLSG